jgi:hypothetical protein
VRDLSCSAAKNLRGNASQFAIAPKLKCTLGVVQFRSRTYGGREAGKPAESTGEVGGEVGGEIGGEIGGEVGGEIGSYVAGHVGGHVAA